MKEETLYRTIWRKVLELGFDGFNETDSVEVADVVREWFKDHPQEYNIRDKSTNEQKEIIRLRKTLNEIKNQHLPNSYHETRKFIEDALKSK